MFNNTAFSTMNSISLKIAVAFRKISDLLVRGENILVFTKRPGLRESNLYRKLYNLIIISVLEKEV